MRLFIILFLAMICTAGNAQQTVSIYITAEENNTPVEATILIKGNKSGSQSDSTGKGSISFPGNGKYTLIISAIGYEEKQMNITIPYSSETFIVQLEHEEHEEEEIIVQSTRTSRTIANVPTRVETIEMEEIDEKNNMRPSNVAMLLHESTGIQVQQTSATSGNAGIRIQGLDGKYTQLLKDGFANFGNFSSGLSVLEIPPLDLKQVEIIKGPASPLFGGGAIAGVINFISKTPKEESEYNFLLNQSTIGQTNIGSFISGRGKKIGYTVLGLYNRQKAYDVDNDDFTEVPESNEFTIHPKLFIYPDEKTTIQIGNSFTTGERTGGDIEVINGKTDASHQYFEKNKTTRNISTFEFDKHITANKRFVAKQSFSIFDRTITVPSYGFAGTDHTAFTDVAYITNKAKHALVAGANFIYNKFTEDAINNKRDNKVITGGLYAQHTLDATEKIKLETGLRIDVVNYKNSIYSKSEVFVLPRVSVLIKYDSKWSSRIGAGMGYKTPTLFTEETETIQYRNVAQLNNVTSEKSYGGTADINFRTNITPDLLFTFNHMFFYTMIDNPLILQGNLIGGYRFANASKPVRSAGFESNAKLIYHEHLKLFLGYTFTDSKVKYLPGNPALTLVPKHKLNTALIYEKHGVIKLGLEGYFTGQQHLTNGGTTPVFEELGFMAEKIFKKFSIYINFENFTDTRQSRYKNVVNGSHLNPTFDEIWTHTEGFVMNGGIKLRL
jgi:iron complex outermembrane receptor protein/outer membrane receptor for ferrienterochelin and colicins